MFRINAWSYWREKPACKTLSLQKSTEGAQLTDLDPVFQPWKSPGNEIKKCYLYIGFFSSWLLYCQVMGSNEMSPSDVVAAVGSFLCVWKEMRCHIATAQSWQEPHVFSSQVPSLDAVVVCSLLLCFWAWVSGIALHRDSKNGSSDVSQCRHKFHFSQVLYPKSGFHPVAVVHQ